MNKTQLIRLRSVKQRLRINLVNMKDLIRWCEDYKEKCGGDKCGIDLGQIMSVFTLKYADIVFIISNLEEIKKLEEK